MKSVKIILLTTCLIFSLFLSEAKSQPVLNTNSQQNLLKISSITYDITSYGALGNGKTMNTKSIQSAINDCYKNGGGTVLVPPGIFLSGTIELKENVYLYLSSGAVIKGSSDSTDYRRTYLNFKGLPDRAPFDMDQYLIFALNTKNTGITGNGLIDAQGELFYNTQKTQPTIKYKPSFSEYLLKTWRPGPTVCFYNCGNITLRDVTVLNNPMFAVAIIHCNTVFINNIKVKTDLRFQNGDGIHIISSQNICISDCIIESEDDALCMYSDWGFHFSGDRSSSNITVNNCILSSACAGIRIGYLGSDNIENVFINNVIIRKALKAIDFICNSVDVLAVFTPIANSVINSGSHIKNIAISNLIVNDAIFGLAMNIQPDVSGAAGIENITFSGINIRSRYGNKITGCAERPVKNITFRDVQFSITGDIRDIAKPIPDTFPVFGSPSYPYALVIRDAQDIRFFNSRIIFDGAPEGWESAVFCERSDDIDQVGLKVIGLQHIGNDAPEEK